MTTESTAGVLERLPLRPAQLAVLSSLAHGPAPGVEMLEHAERVGSGARVLGAGTLYRLLREMASERLIERAPAPARTPERRDERRQYYRLTHLGRAVLEAEASRLARTLGDAGLLPAGPDASGV